MCGIIGVINSDGTLGERELAVLNDTMHKRGPDGAGLFWDGQTGIAMRRLAIIDLVGGQQPLFSEDRDVVVVMNGEIYNYASLRKDLIAAGHQFSTHSDTETLVHGYQEYGIDGLLERVDGMYAFAIWDRTKSRMFLARDRFGEKPLYFAREGGKVIFGSQLLTVVAGLGDNPPISAESLQLYWSLHFVPGDRTIFEGVRRVRPGEAYEFDVASGEELRRWTYWKLREGTEKKLDPGELSEIVADAVRSRLIADVPVGVFLSGGLDSSLLASLAAQQAPGIHTFSIGFDSRSHDESGYAWEVADYVGATHHHFMFQVNEFRALIPESHRGHGRAGRRSGDAAAFRLGARGVPGGEGGAVGRGRRRAFRRLLLLCAVRAKPFAGHDRSHPYASAPWRGGSRLFHRRARADRERLSHGAPARSEEAIVKEPHPRRRDLA